MEVVLNSDAVMRPVVDRLLERMSTSIRLRTVLSSGSAVSVIVAALFASFVLEFVPWQRINVVPSDVALWTVALLRTVCLPFAMLPIGEWRERLLDDFARRVEDLRDEYSTCSLVHDQTQTGMGDSSYLHFGFFMALLRDFGDMGSVLGDLTNMCVGLTRRQKTSRSSIIVEPVYVAYARLKRYVLRSQCNFRRRAALASALADKSMHDMIASEHLAHEMKLERIAKRSRKRAGCTVAAYTLNAVWERRNRYDGVLVMRLEMLFTNSKSTEANDAADEAVKVGPSLPTLKYALPEEEFGLMAETVGALDIAGEVEICVGTSVCKV
ncbi:hypothetical protein T492DRAFT_839583 [Pavlovales sp. CCMP2436]|nr:hypothetical protein T492DRAFT_839583 [Pavlovales sp. CCMP2436]